MHFKAKLVGAGSFHKSINISLFKSPKRKFKNRELLSPSEGLDIINSPCFKIFANF